MVPGVTAYSLENTVMDGKENYSLEKVKKPDQSIISISPEVRIGVNNRTFACRRSLIKFSSMFGDLIGTWNKKRTPECHSNERAQELDPCIRA